MVAQEIEGVVFDLDNTLVDRQAAMMRWLARLIPATLDHAQRAQLIEDAIAQDALGYSERLPFCEQLATSLQGCGVTVRGEELWERLRAELGSCVEPIPGLKELVRALGQRYTLAILSNGSSANQRLKLQYSALLECFDPAYVVISSELGVQKPAPQAFEHMSALLGRAPTRLIFVGDHPIADVQGAQAVGMKTAWMSLGRPWPLELKRPDYTLTTILELANLLPIPRGEDVCRP